MAHAGLCRSLCNLVQVSCPARSRARTGASPFAARGGVCPGSSLLSLCASLLVTCLAHKSCATRTGAHVACAVYAALCKPPHLPFGPAVPVRLVRALLRVIFVCYSVCKSCVARAVSCGSVCSVCLGRSRSLCRSWRSVSRRWRAAAGGRRTVGRAGQSVVAVCKPPSCYLVCKCTSLLVQLGSVPGSVHSVPLVEVRVATVERGRRGGQSGRPLGCLALTCLAIWRLQRERRLLGGLPPCSGNSRHAWTNRWAYASDAC